MVEATGPTQVRHFCRPFSAHAACVDEIFARAAQSLIAELRFARGLHFAEGGSLPSAPGGLGTSPFDGKKETYVPSRLFDHRNRVDGGNARSLIHGTSKHGCSLRQLLLGNWDGLHVEVRCRHGQLRRRFDHDVWLRGVYRCRRHGCVHNRVPDAMPDESWGLQL